MFGRLFLILFCFGLSKGKAQYTKWDTIQAMAEQFAAMPKMELIKEHDYLVYIVSKVPQDSLVFIKQDSSNIALWLGSFWYNYVGNNFLSVRSEYLQRIAMANNMFSNSLHRGYLSDRGRVLMVYGHPNDKQIVKNKSNTKPYEVWYYNRIQNGQSGIEFVFYNEHGMINEFSLIHSNARGELMNASWKNLIYFKDAPDMHKSDYQQFDSQKNNVDF